MSKKLKMPEKGLFGLPSSVRQVNNEESTSTQEKGITAKRLDVEESGSLSAEETSLLGDQDILPQNVQETNLLDVQEVESLGDKGTIHLSTQESSKLSNKTSKRQEVQASKRLKAEKLNSQTSQRLDAIPQDAQTSNQLEVKPLGDKPAELPVDKTLKHLGYEETIPLNGETTKRKQAKSASLVKKTYYIDHDLDGAIELMAVLQKGDQSDIVRQLLRSAIPEYYLTQWKVMSNHSK